jgi:hypothetical protein
VVVAGSLVELTAQPPIAAHEVIDSRQSLSPDRY